jgi:hypothetical protein
MQGEFFLTISFYAADSLPVTSLCFNAELEQGKVQLLVLAPQAKFTLTLRASKSASFVLYLIQVHKHAVNFEYPHF